VSAVADGATPAGLNWDMWTGPAPEAAYNPNFHHGWNHFWRFSGGDIINDGVHQMDLARWLVGKDYPQSVYSTGGRYAEKGVFESPDTQVAVFQFDDLVFTFELTLYTPYMLKSDAALRDSDMFPYWPQNGERIEIYGSQGLMIVGRHGCGWQVYDRPKDRKPVVAQEQNGPFPDHEHFDNFVQSIRNRQRPNADIEEGHRSTLMCQLANISYRLGGKKLVIDADSETVVDDAEANAMLKREYRAPWVVPETV
jgi:predicted dehydrogenase